MRALTLVVVLAVAGSLPAWAQGFGSSDGFGGSRPLVSIPLTPPGSPLGAPPGNAPPPPGYMSPQGVYVQPTAQSAGNAPPPANYDAGGSFIPNPNSPLLLPPRP